MSASSTCIRWFEDWAGNQFQGIKTTQPPTEPSVDDVEIQAQLELIQHQVPDLKAVIRTARTESFHGKLVRLYMAVTETMDPEYYPGAVQDQKGEWSCTKYGNDSAVMQHGSPKKVVYWERLPVCVQRIPGIAEWCHDKGSVDCVCSGLANHSICDMSFPDPNEPDGDTCVVLLYDSAAASVQIHDVIDVIGVLDHGQYLEDSHMDQDFADDFDVMMNAENFEGNENVGAQLPKYNARRILRIHAMHVKLLKNLGSSPYEHMFIKRSMAGEFFRQMHTASIDWLARPFGGDRLCGELLLLQLLCKNSGINAGRVSRRMTLNIYSCQWGSKNHVQTVSCEGKSWGSVVDPDGCSPGRTSRIADAVAAAISAVYPFVFILPVTDSATASRSLFPYHDASANRLRTGMLQQAPHACIILDECSQASTPVAVTQDSIQARNVQRLHTFLANGILEADYAWQQVQLPVSGSALALSTKSSAFASTCHVSVCTANAQDQDHQPRAQTSLPLQGIRSYLASAWDLWDGLSYVSGRPGRDPSSTEWVQQKLVSHGKAMASALNGLSSACSDTVRAYEATVVLLHCVAISHGKNNVSENEWSLLEDLVQRVAKRGHATTGQMVQKIHGLVQPIRQGSGADVNDGLHRPHPVPTASAGEAAIAML